MQDHVQHLTKTLGPTLLSSEQLFQTTSLMVATDAVVARGQRAWHRIKATAAEQRELWREVGEALLVGRRMHKSDKLFGQWCKEMGFSDVHPRYRSAAIWLAQNWEVSRSVTPGSSDPIQIQKEFNEQQHTALLPADLSDIQAESIETIELDERSAEKVAKLSRRAKAGDEGSAIAQRHIEALAKKHNTTIQKLEEAAEITAPAAYHCFTPAQVEALENVRRACPNFCVNGSDFREPLITPVSCGVERAQRSNQ